jgi:hypothetical protein
MSAVPVCASQPRDLSLAHSNTYAGRRVSIAGDGDEGDGHPRNESGGHLGRRLLWGVSGDGRSRHIRSGESQEDKREGPPRRSRCRTSGRKTGSRGSRSRGGGWNGREGGIEGGSRSKTWLVME